jgi:hypothetical protein
MLRLVTETAQDVYRRLIRDHLAPGFRGLGLVGSGSNYVLPDPKHWRLVGLYRHKWSTSRQVLFTVDMGVSSKAAWEAVRVDPMWAGSLPERPSSHAAEPVGLSWRIGAVLAPGDTWWAVTPGQPLDPIADEILTIVRDGAVPWLKRLTVEPNYYKTDESRDAARLVPRLGRRLTDFEIDFG